MDLQTESHRSGQVSPVQHFNSLPKTIAKFKDFCKPFVFEFLQICWLVTVASAW